jgi:hypothetical protein
MTLAASTEHRQAPVGELFSAMASAAPPLHEPWVSRKVTSPQHADGLQQHQ